MQVCWSGERFNGFLFGVFLTRNLIESAHFSFFSDIKNILRHRLGSLTNTICYTNKNYWANNVSNQSTSQHFLYILLPDFNVFRAKMSLKVWKNDYLTLIIIFVLLLPYVSLSIWSKYSIIETKVKYNTINFHY